MWAISLGFVVWGEIPSVPLIIGSAVVVASGLFLIWRESNARQANVPGLTRYRRARRAIRAVTRRRFWP